MHFDNFLWRKEHVIHSKQEVATEKQVDLSLQEATEIGNKLKCRHNTDIDGNTVQLLL